MTEQHSEEMSIFLSAIEIDSVDKRNAYLDTVCRENPKLRAAVEALLREHELPQGLLDSPDMPAPTFGFASIAEMEKPGMMIGRYKLVHEIGHGGMGVVYMAVQKEPVKRQVALKIIKPGMDTREVVARFEAERQALALMDHQSIAHVLDGGSTESGRPYFVMELVDGTPITDYCDECRFTTRQRLELFIKVCQAVQHAHLKGVIHRDIKPSNILVTNYDHIAVPKVIDFGIAKALRQPLTDASVHTQVTQMIGTPMYMSPEQAQRSGLDVDTRTDVYSLGVLLYELLTGATPFDKQRFQESGLDEVKRIIREEEPPKPSTRLSTLGAALDTVVEKHHTDRRTLTKELSGELDWLVMKALEKDRNRRYESASGLANDVQRYLDDEPVEACPPSTTYRFGKFCRRNKTSLAIASLILCALALGLAGTTWQTRRAVAAENLAEQRLQDAEEQAQLAQANYVRAREAVKQMLTRVADEELATIPEMKDIRRRLLEDAAAFYTKLLEVNPRDSQAYLERGQVYELLGEYDKVRPDYEKASQLAPDNSEFHHQLAYFLSHVPDTAYRDNERAILHMKCAVQLEPGNAGYQSALGEIYHRQGRKDEALVHYRRACALKPDAYLARFRMCQLTGDLHGALEVMQKKAEFGAPSAWDYFEIGHMYRARRNHQEAIAAYTKAIDMAQTIRDESADTTRFYRYTARGDSYTALGMYEQALADYDKAVELGPFRSYTYKRRGLMHFRLGHYDQALADIAKAIELKPDDDSNVTWIPLDEVAKCPDESFRKGILELADKVVELNDGAAEAQVKRIHVYAAFGREEEALGDLDQAMATLQDLVENVPNAPEHRKQLAELESALASWQSREHRERAEVRRARGELDSAVADWTEVIRLHPNDADAYRRRGASLLGAGQLGAAMDDCNQAIRLRPDWAWAYSTRGDVHAAKGDLNGAVADYEQAMQRNPKWEWPLLRRGLIYERMGNPRKALADYEKAVELGPWNSFPFKHRARLYFGLGHYDQALADIVKAIEVKPDDWSNTTWIPLAEVAKCSDESFREGILALADRVVELNDGASEAQVMRIRVYAAFGREEEALADLEAAIAKRRALAQSSPKAAAYRTNLARLQAALAQWHVSRGYGSWLGPGPLDDALVRFSKAITILRKLATEYPEEPRYQADLAVAYKARGKASGNEHRERKMQDLTEAIDICRKLIARSQNVPARHWGWRPPHILARGLSWRGLLLSQQGQLAEAVADCSEALRSDPAYSEAYRVRADAYLRQADYARAAADYAEIRKRESTDAVKDYQWALMYVGAGDLESYRAVCREIVRERAHTESAAEAHWTAWTCALAPDATDDWPTVVGLAKKAAEADGNSQQYLVTLGAVLYRAEQWEEAIECLEEAERLLRERGPQEHTSPAYLWYLLAMAYQKLNRIDDVKRFLATALEWTDVVLAADSETESACLAWNRRLTLELLREEAKRIPVYSELTVSQDAPQNSEPPHPALWQAYLARAEAFAASGKPDEAIADCNVAIRIDPQHDDNYRIRGFAHAWKGEDDLALADFAKLDELGAYNGAEYRRAATLLLSGKQEQYREACADLVREQADSEDASQVYLAARACVLAPAAVNDPDVPVAMAQRAVALKPGVAWQVHTLGMACCRAGQLDEAERTLRESLEVKPDWPARYLNWLGLALVDHQRGDEQKAHEWFTKATDWMHEHRADDLNITNWMEGELLRREVEKLLDTRQEDSQDRKREKQSEGRD
jgi:tetratricopeptide (TPR) repeat protein/tRNA A-37 threonylcarbamoyl transferase component Bud32